MNDQEKLTHRLAKNAIVLALYIVFTFISYPISFMGLQFRISEIFVLLCFFNRDYVIAITFGCFLCNFASPMMPWDLLIGTGATLVSCLTISFMKHLGIAILVPIIANSFLVGYEYFFILNQPFWISVGEVAIGEATIIVIGYVLCLLVMKKESMQHLLDVKRNQDFKW